MAHPRHPSTSTPTTTFDIVAQYNKTIKSDPNLPAPLAAIESLITLLSENPLTTVAETLALLSHQTTILLASQRNPIPLSAGTDLFQRYIISSFQARPTSSSLPTSDFSALRKHLISNSRVFVSRAKTASSKISAHAQPFIKDGATIFTYTSPSTSRVINTLLQSTTESSASSGRYISVTQITSPTCPASRNNTTTTTNQTPNTTTTTLPLHSLAYTLSSLPHSAAHTHALFLLPCHAVLRNGSVVAPLGTHTLALLASAFSIPLYFAVESFRFVREYPLGTGRKDLERIGVRQPVNVESDDDSSSASDDSDENTNTPPRKTTIIDQEEEKLDITPPNLITALITENGVMTPQAVSEEWIKILI